MTENKIKIELTEKECEVFKWFMKNYDIFEKAIKILRPGRLILNLNTKGDIKPEFHIIGREGVDKCQFVEDK